MNSGDVAFYCLCFSLICMSFLSISSGYFAAVPAFHNILETFYALQVHLYPNKGSKRLHA